LGRLVDEGKEPEDLVAELFWTILCRAPSPPEMQSSCAYVTRGADARAAGEDLAWALLNSKEFLFRR
jgi:hypothetical protein